MLHAALALLVVSVVGAIVLYTGIAGDSLALKLVFPVAYALYVLAVVRGLGRGPRR
jgi:uncharacterized membrane protein YtjA (UPF0391 family)